MNISHLKSALEVNDPRTQPLHPNGSVNAKSSPCQVASVSLGPAGSGRPGLPLPSTNLELEQANRATHTPLTSQIGPATWPGRTFQGVCSCSVVLRFYSDSCRLCRHPLAQLTLARHGEHMISRALTRFLSPSLPISLHSFPQNCYPKP